MAVTRSEKRKEILKLYVAGMTGNYKKSMPCSLRNPAENSNLRVPRCGMIDVTAQCACELTSESEGLLPHY
jgi:hypothetical protein